MGRLVCALPLPFPTIIGVEDGRSGGRPSRRTGPRGRCTEGAGVSCWTGGAIVGDLRQARASQWTYGAIVGDLGETGTSRLTDGAAVGDKVGVVGRSGEITGEPEASAGIASLDFFFFFFFLDFSRGASLEMTSKALHLDERTS